MSDLTTALNQLETEFTEAFEACGDGHSLGFLLFPIGADVARMGPVTIEAGSIPRAYLAGASWAEPFGVLVLTDHAHQSHGLIAFVTGTEASREPFQCFIRLARRAGATCFRLARGLAATGSSNAPELNWLGTLYAYLKGTEYVEEGPGFSRFRSVFAASLAMLSLFQRGDLKGEIRGYTGSLRPGIPGVDGEAFFTFAPLDTSARVPAAPETPTPRAECVGQAAPPAAEPPVVSPPATPPDSAPPEVPAGLTPTAAAVWRLLRSKSGKGLQGKEVVSALAKEGITVQESTLRRHVFPSLEAHGLKNHRARGGYYLDPAA